jgi:hypothetical protein
MPLGGVQVGSFDTYEQAQAAVDFLSDQKFPVENVTIIGSDLRQVERVTGRLTWGRVLAAGAAGGAWWGLFVGLLLGIFAVDGSAWIGSLLTGLLIGLLFGMLFAAIGYSASRGQRDFTSTSAVIAGRYDIMCNPARAEEARAHLARFSLRGWGPPFPHAAHGGPSAGPRRGPVQRLAARPRPGSRPELAKGGEDGVLPR